MMREKFPPIKSKQPHLPPQPDGDVWSPTLSKLLSRDADWDKDSLGDVLHWMRQAVALLLGIIWGAIPLTGAFWLALFLVLSSGIVYGYYHLILKVDEEELGGNVSLLQEGLPASVSLFLLAWTTVYSLLHF